MLLHGGSRALMVFDVGCDNHELYLIEGIDAVLFAPEHSLDRTPAELGRRDHRPQLDLHVR